MRNAPDPLEQYGLCGGIVAAAAAIVGGLLGLMVLGWVVRLLGG